MYLIFQSASPIWCRWLAYLPFTQDTRVRVPVSEDPFDLAIIWLSSQIKNSLLIWLSFQIKNSLLIWLSSQIFLPLNLNSIWSSKKFPIRMANVKQMRQFLSYRYVVLSTLLVRLSYVHLNTTLLILEKRCSIMTSRETAKHVLCTAFFYHINRVLTGESSHVIEELFPFIKDSFHVWCLQCFIILISKVNFSLHMYYIKFKHLKFNVEFLSLITEAYSMASFEWSNRYIFFKYQKRAVRKHYPYKILL
jgi:hypothetical protein